MFNKEKIVERFCVILANIIMLVIALLPTIFVVSATLPVLYSHELLSNSTAIELYVFILLCMSPLLIRCGVELVE